MLTLKIFTIIFIIVALVQLVTVLGILKSKDKNKSKTVLLASLPYTLICILLNFTSGELMDESIFTSNTVLFSLTVLIIVLQIAAVIVYFRKFNTK